MLKVLIVEDENIIRKGLIHTIDWLSMGCIVVGDACNGLEGLKLIEECQPDLVITDIRMPVLNGIEMIEKAMENSRFISIILTSYSEFEYAKQAISLKVFEYLLKPVDEEKLRRIIDNVKHKINQEKLYDDFIEKGKISKGIDLINLDAYIFLDKKLSYYVNEALKQIRLNYHKKISIESIANDLGVSPSYLSRRFKDETSQTFLDILNKYRIQKAVELLNIGKYRVYEVSDLTGFSEYKHFCSVFKKYIKASPSDFIKEGGLVVLKNTNPD